MINGSVSLVFGIDESFCPMVLIQIVLGDFELATLFRESRLIFYAVCSRNRILSTSVHANQDFVLKTVGVPKQENLLKRHARHLFAFWHHNAGIGRARESQSACLKLFLLPELSSRAKRGICFRRGAGKSRSLASLVM